MQRELAPPRISEPECCAARLRSSKSRPRRRAPKLSREVSRRSHHQACTAFRSGILHGQPTGARAWTWLPHRIARPTPAIAEQMTHVRLASKADSQKQNAMGRGREISAGLVAY